MPAAQGNRPSIAFGNTNKTLREEIRDDIADKLKTIADVKRVADSIVVSDNFHLDSKFVSGQWKVEVQFRRGSKQTVAVVLVDPNAANLVDLQNAIFNSARDGFIWLVT